MQRFDTIMKIAKALGALSTAPLMKLCKNSTGAQNGALFLFPIFKARGVKLEAKIDITLQHTK
ncbi:hypothetical protein [Desulfovibrio sp. MES5]|uniref:hypothetical protein n=1 Tax=Desulfovibrio sp. MES5 TaxID=1899016 RepID=UPI0025C1A22F|nr:hypothetical protein [Desulfovibrio sp. MES5]